MIKKKKDFHLHIVYAIKGSSNINDISTVWGYLWLLVWGPIFSRLAIVGVEHRQWQGLTNLQKS